MQSTGTLNKSLYISFMHIVGFGGTSFLPHLAVCFLQKLVMKWFIEGYLVNQIMEKSLNEEEALRAHSNVFHFTTHCVVELEHAWYHGQLRPLGVPLALQCRFCGRLHTLKTRYKKDCAIISCTDKSCGKDVSVIEYKGGYRLERPKSGESGWATRLHQQLQVA